MNTCISFIYGIIVIFIIIGCNPENNNSQKILNKPFDSLSVSEISVAIRKDPENASLFMKRADLYALLNKPDSAINDAIIATRLDSTKIQYFISLSEMYLVSGHSEESKNILEKCNRINPDNADVLVKIATLYFYVNDYKKAVEYLDKTADIDPRNARMYFIRGMIHKEKKEINSAIVNFQKATESDPAFYDAYMMLGMLYAEQDDSLAVQYYKTASGIKPGEIQPHYNLGMFFQKYEYLDQAIGEYQFILKNLDKSYPYAYFNQGYIYMIYKKEYDKGISYFDSALAVKTDYVEAVYNKGFCYEKLKKYEKAREYYNHAKEMVTNYPLAIDGLNRLDKKK